MKPTAYGAALLTLAEYYKVEARMFQQELPRVVVEDWAASVVVAQQVARAKGKGVAVELPLTTWQHQFLVGDRGVAPTRTKLIERLSGASLAVLGRWGTVLELAERVGVRV